MGCTHPPSLFLSSLPLSHVRALLPFSCSNRPVSLLTLRLATCVSYLSLVKCFCSSIPRSSFFTVLVYYVRVAVTQSCIAHVLEANLFRELPRRRRPLSRWCSSRELPSFCGRRFAKNHVLPRRGGNIRAHLLCNPLEFPARTRNYAFRVASEHTTEEGRVCVKYLM